MDTIIKAHGIFSSNEKKSIQLKPLKSKASLFLGKVGDIIKNLKHWDPKEALLKSYQSKIMNGKK